MLLLAACRPAGPAVNQELVINGGFESPPAPSGAFPIGAGPVIPEYGTGSDVHIIPSIAPGAEPPGFGWKVEAGDVDIIGYGYDSGGGDVYLGAATEGKQSLDLDGRHAGTIAQAIPTEAGGVYALTFAYANNPDSNVVNDQFRARVTVVDVASHADLIPPREISHTGSTPANFHWTRAGPLLFTARGPSTIIRFASEDDPESWHGISLDDVSVKVVSLPIFVANPYEGWLIAGLALVAALFIVHLLVSSRRPSVAHPSD